MMSYNAMVMPIGILCSMIHGCKLRHYVILSQVSCCRVPGEMQCDRCMHSDTYMYLKIKLMTLRK